jgi:hypothetical protein
MNDLKAIKLYVKIKDNAEEIFHSAKTIKFTQRNNQRTFHEIDGEVLENNNINETMKNLNFTDYEFIWK